MPWFLGSFCCLLGLLAWFACKETRDSPKHRQKPRALATVTQLRLAETKPPAFRFWLKSQNCKGNQARIGEFQLCGHNCHQVRPCAITTVFFSVPSRVSFLASWSLSHFYRLLVALGCSFWARCGQKPGARGGVGTPQAAWFLESQSKDPRPRLGTAAFFSGRVLNFDTKLALSNNFDVLTCCRRHFSSQQSYITSSWLPLL